MIKRKMVMLLKTNIVSFVYYNFLCSKVHRTNGALIIPYKGTHIQIDKGASIHINETVYLNINKTRGSKAECLVWLREGAKWTVNGQVNLYYGTTLQVHKNAELTVGNMGMNTGSVMICAYKMTIGQYVSMGRNVYVFDSDHHPIYNENGERINEAKEVIIGDRVWLGLKTTVLKGSHIESDTVVSANSLVSGNLPSNALVATIPARPVMKGITWER